MTNKVKPKRFAVGGYTGTAQTTFDPNNAYTRGLGAERVFNFDTLNSSGDPLKEKLPLIPAPKVRTAWEAWNELPFQTQKYYVRKGAVSGGPRTNGVWAYNTGLIDPLAKDKTEADLIAAMNVTNSKKGAAPITRWDVNEINSIASPLIAKRNRRTFKEVVGPVLSIAQMIPGPQQPFIMAANAAYNASQGDILGAAMSAAGAYGGFTGAGNAVKAVSGPLKGKYVIPGVMNTARGISMPASNAILGAGNLGRLASPFERVLADSRKLGYGNKISGAVGPVLGAFGSQQDQQQQEMAPETITALLAQLQQQQGGGGSAFTRNFGRGVVQRANGGPISSMLPSTPTYAKGRMVQGAGDGMSDDVPATIDGAQPAMLSDGEHVVPSLQVSMLGRGSSKAGSKKVSDIVLKEIEKMYGKGVNPKKMQQKAMSKKNGN